MRPRSPVRSPLPALAALLAAALLAPGDTSARRTPGRPADDPPLLPLERLLAKPQVVTAQLSPDGESLALVERDGASTAVVLRDGRGQRIRRVWADTARAVSNVRWSRDGRWLLVLHDRGGDEGHHLLRLDPHAPGAPPVDLTPFPGTQVELVALPARRPTTAIVTSTHRDPRVADAYAVELASGAIRMLARNPGDVTGYAADARGAVVAASAVRRDGTFELRTREPRRAGPASAGRGGAGWRTILRVGVADRAALVGVTGGTRGLPRRVWVRSNAGAAFESLRALDPVSGAVRAVHASRCGAVDAGTPHHGDDDRLLGEQCTAAAPAFRATDARLDALVSRLVARGDTARAVELESRSADGRRLLFYTHASTDPGRYVLLDVPAGRATPLFAAHPALDGAALAPSAFHPFAARDGLRLSLVLTRSPVAAAGPQPTVLVVHGGPWTREALGYSAETQLLANRGYAVLQVNFRGSTGLGRAVVDAAVGEFGGRMSDDLLDALAWGVRAGAVDPARVCIVGGSYGGYAALVGLTRDAPRFRCGASWAGPVDLETLVRAFPPSWGPFLPRSWHRFVGHPDRPAEAARMRRASPLHQLDRARAPLLLFQGANDPRVRPDQTVRVLRAWRARGLPATLLYADDEGHGFNEETTALAVNRALEAFLAGALGGRLETPPAPAVAAAVERLTAAGERLLAGDGAAGVRR